MSGLYSASNPEHQVINLTDPANAICNLYGDIRHLKTEIAKLRKLAQAVVDSHKTARPFNYRTDRVLVGGTELTDLAVALRQTSEPSQSESQDG